MFLTFKPHATSLPRHGRVFGEAATATSPGGPWEITIQGCHSVTCNNLHEIRFLAESCPKKVAKTLDHKGPGNKRETHRDDGLQSGISLVEDVTVGHRTSVPVAPPFLCRCTSGCSIFHVLSPDGTLRRRSFVYTARKFDRLRDVATFSPYQPRLSSYIDSAMRRHATIGCLSYHTPRLPPLASVPSRPDSSHRIVSGCTYFTIIISVR